MRKHTESVQEVDVSAPDGPPDGNRTHQAIVWCPLCKQARSIWVKPEDWKTWTGEKASRPLIQVVFPYLSTADRVGIDVGICDPCWIEMFGPDDEDVMNAV